MGDRSASRKAMQGGKSEQDRATAVANGHPGRPAGKCHRKYTADIPMRKQAMVKWCGKSAPRRR